VQVVAQQTYVLVITGLGGEAQYTEQFHEWAVTLIDAATSLYKVPPENVTYLGEDPKLAPELITARSSRENVEAAIGDISEHAVHGDHVVMVLFGHGSFTDKARINLPGRDLSADDFSDLVRILSDQQITFVNTASASGPFIEKLSGDGRVIATATRSGGEQQAAVFGGYFVEAFSGGQDEADQNKDRRVSMLEAFRYARLRVEQNYATDGLLATEHALLDDNGDGEGTGDPDPLAGDGMLAQSLFFTGGEERRVTVSLLDDPRLVSLYEEQRVLETRVDELQRLRDSIGPEQYQQELERILIKLARKSREIRELDQTKTELERK
jgi:hypothetical protein